MADSAKVCPELKFSVCADDLRMPHWERFRDKFCIEVAEDHKVCDTLVSVIENFGTYQSTTDDAEMTGNGIVDTLLNIMCATIMQNRSRNAAIATSDGDRPDYALNIIFVGMDKLRRNYAPGALGKDPRVDLLSHTPFPDWDKVYGADVPFIVGYTSINSEAGADFQLGLIGRTSKTFHPLHDPLNLSVPQQRAQAAECALLVRPAVLALHRKLIRNRVCAPLSYTRHHIFPSVTISVVERVRKNKRIVEKVWMFEALEDALDLCSRMQHVFKALGSAYPFQMLDPVIHVCAKDALTVKAFFTPVGTPYTVTSLAAAYWCAMDMLDALEVLKGKGIVHHDIRAINIICVPAVDRGGVEHRYVVIDFDDARLVDAQGNCPAVSSRTLDPRTHCNRSYEVHGCEVDLWSVGQLLRESTGIAREVVILGDRIQQQCVELTLAEARTMVQECFTPLLGLLPPPVPST